jgi:hypothetical protein
MGARSKEHPLLRTLVVCGASLVGLGCGARTESSGTAEGGSSAASGQGGYAGGAGGAATIRCPEQCSSPAQLVCDDVAKGTNCRCDPDAPLDARACETIWDYGCESATAAPGCAPFIAFSPWISCTCSPDRLRPEDCESPTQFSCPVFEPVADGCYCDASAPRGPADCVGLQEYRCHYYKPDIACRCDKFVPIK